MTYKQYEIIYQIQIAFFILGAVFSFIRFRKREKHIKLIGLYCLASAIADISAILLLKHLKVNPNYVSAVFYILTFPILSWLYVEVTGSRGKKILMTITVLYCSFGIVNLLFIQMANLNSYTLILLSLIIISYCLYYFYWLLKELPTTHLHRLPMFWINSGLMVYYSGNLFLFVFTSYLVHVLKNNLALYWSLHNFLGIIEFSLIIFALWTDLRNIKLRPL